MPFQVQPSQEFRIFSNHGSLEYKAKLLPQILTLKNIFDFRKQIAMLNKSKNNLLKSLRKSDSCVELWTSDPV